MTPRVLAGLVAALLLASCGGGGGGGSPAAPPPPALPNTPPVWTTGPFPSVPEGSLNDITQLTVRDAEDDPITFGIGTALDGPRFELRQETGGRTYLRFKAPAPDFENPSDADRDNVYDLAVTASDGRAVVSLIMRVTVTDQSTGVRVRRVATGLEEPIYVQGLPDGSGRIIVAERAGRMRVMNPATGAITGDFLDLRGQVATQGERGLLSFLFSQSHRDNGLVYLMMSNAGGDTEIRRYRTVAGAADRLDPATSDVILQIPQPPGRDNHKGGMLSWWGLSLLIGVGDGGGQGDPDGNAQNPHSLLGKLLRIDVDSDGFDDFPGDPLRDYRIPLTNPMRDGVAGRPEIQAMGLRNPFRGVYDTNLSRIIIADVGEGLREELNGFEISTQNGLLVNYGWNRREGTLPFNGGANSPAFTPPALEYAHGAGPDAGNSIVGGDIYRGPNGGMGPAYYFADFVSGNIWSITSFEFGHTLPISRAVNRTTQFRPDIGQINAIVALNAVGDHLYIVDFDGELFRVESID